LPTLDALGGAAHDYHDEALETLGEEYDPNRQPDIALVEANLEALAKNGRQSRSQHADDLASMPPSVCDMTADRARIPLRVNRVVHFGASPLVKSQIRRICAIHSGSAMFDDHRAAYEWALVSDR
jgi:hypothetical protein